MATDSSEQTHRKNHRSSPTDDVEEHSKRCKNRHHYRHRRSSRHRSSKDKEESTHRVMEELESPETNEIEVEVMKLETTGGEDHGDSLCEASVLGGLGFRGVDYEMEEGEIVEDDYLVEFGYEDSDKLQKNVNTDVELGKIGTTGCGDSNMRANEWNTERIDKKNLKKDNVTGKESREKHLERLPDSMTPANADYVKKCDHIGRMTSDCAGDVDRHSLKIFSSRFRDSLHSHSRENYMKESSHSRLIKSPDRSTERYRSRSLAPEASLEDLYFKERSKGIDSSDEWVTAHNKPYRLSSRDVIKEKDREKGSSRHMERTERHYGRETLGTYMERSRERNWDSDRSRQKEKEDMDRVVERNKHIDGYRGEKEQDIFRVRKKERERDKDRDREDARDGRWSRSRDDDGDTEREWLLRRREKYERDEDAYRDRENDFRHRRNSDNHHRERARRIVLENVSYKDERKEGGVENFEKEDDNEEDYQDKIAMQLAEQEEDDLERIKEESRKRKQAILEKYNSQHQQSETSLKDMIKDQVGETTARVVFGEVIPKRSDNRVEGARNGFSAPEPSFSVPEPYFYVGKLPAQNGFSAPQQTAGTGLGEDSAKSKRLDDMFSDDIFGESTAGVRKTGKDDVVVEKGGLHDNWDDAEGYYGYRLGEVLDGRYEIIAPQGKGVFSAVVRSKDLKAKPGDPEEVAIKIICNNETMYKAGMEELVILKKLVGTDPENRRHCVRFLSTFKYRNHLCLVFESLHMNLREVLKKFGRNIGLKLTAVRTYAKQLLIALKHLKNCGVLHCDIKPDNMLVNEAKNVLKLCDFGNAMFAGKNEITPYLVSRFYRAPEIILGLPYGHPMDVWSVGCCLFELYTGKVLFPGATNNDMLRLHMELKGPFPKKMLRKGAFIDQHFDQDLNFLATGEDPVSKKAIRRLVVNIKPKDFGTLILGSPGEGAKMVANFKDLMEKIFVLDPDKRLNVLQALSHPFITGRTPKIAWDLVEVLRDFLEGGSYGSPFGGLFSVSMDAPYAMRDPFSALDD